MGKVFEKIDGELERWISEQVMFFVGSAPEDGGHVNVSPKAPIESFAVLDPHTVAYLDLVGSGVETIAHARQNGRICIMFCAFEGRPRIVRLHGRAEVMKAGSPEFGALLSRPVEITADKLEVLDREHKAIYRGQEIGFCSPSCKAKFEADPERFLGEPTAPAAARLTWPACRSSWVSRRRPGA